jgi:hypothetical protein
MKRWVTDAHLLVESHEEGHGFLEHHLHRRTQRHIPQLVKAEKSVELEHQEVVDGSLHPKAPVL